MQPLTSWAIFIALAVGLAWKYGVFDKFTKKADQGGPNRGRTPSRAGDTKLPDWALEADKKAKSTAKAAKKQGPRKSVKKAVQEVGNKADAALSGLSSTTGADADDDLSPVQSPSFVAKATSKIPSGKDVSDMLDPKIVPGVLKVNASEKPARPNKPQQQKSESQTQTKKQAQNAKKREAEKAARAEAEAERKKLEEKQRATARQARGEAPKNGVKPSQPPASNAWNRGAAPATNEPVSGQLLDTVENISTASSATNGTAPTPDSTYDNLPSEEDQIAAAMADSAWTTVPKGKKKAKKANGDAGEGSDSGIGHEPTPAPAKSTPAPKKENKKESAKPTSRYEVLSEPISDYRDPRDSDWPVV